MKVIHIIGIGGTGLSAIARVLLESGYRVTGSDRQDSPSLAALKTAGAKVVVGHAVGNIGSADMILRSSAVSDDNPEVIAAHRAGIPVLKRSDFLGELMKDKTGIAVAGTHGKTTTTAMIASIFSALEQEPTFIVGGVVRNLGVNAHAGSGPHFIIEADEYDRMFLGLNPVIAVITNIEHDHPDCYPTEQDFYQAFVEFARLVPPQGSLILCKDDAGSARLAGEYRGHANVTTYGIQAAGTQVKAVNLIAREGQGYAFDVMFAEVTIHVELDVPGEHNVRNAMAALQVAKISGLDLDLAAQALGRFEGAGRRFEIKGEVNGVTLIDDYGHHPTEIQATLSAARARYPGRRLWAVWQPHTYSRTQTLARAFASAFEGADRVLVTEIFASREQPPEGGFSAENVVEVMQHPGVDFVPQLQQACEFMIPRLHSGDIVIVFSAGDADRINEQILAALQAKDNPVGTTSSGVLEEDYAY